MSKLKEKFSFKNLYMVPEIEKIVYADRSKHLGDNDFYKVPADNLLDTNYIKNRSLTINLNYFLKFQP